MNEIKFVSNEYKHLFFNNDVDLRYENLHSNMNKSKLFLEQIIISIKKQVLLYDNLNWIWKYE